MATIEDARSLAAEILAILREETSRRQALVQEISALQQGVVTQAAVDAIEQKNTQARARFRALLEPATKRFTTIANAGVGFLGRSELQQLNDTILAAFAVEDAATETARAALAQLKQSTGNPPGTDSAGDIVGESGQAAAEGAQTQNPQAAPGVATPNGAVASSPPVTSPSNAEPVAGAPGAVTVPPPPGTLPGANVGTAGTESAAGASGGQITAGLPTTPVTGFDQNLTQGQSTATQSYIWQLTGITSKFKAGMFTQSIAGAIVLFKNLPQRAGENIVPEVEGRDESNQSNESAAETARLNRQAGNLPTATSGVAAASTPPPPVVEQSTNSSPPAADDTTAGEAVGPGETEPPTSGNEDVSVAPTVTPPPSTIVVAGATLTATLQVSGRVFIQLTLPSGKSEFNVDGWGDQQWDSLITTLTDTADITAANSLKASWDVLQPQLRQSVQTPTVTTTTNTQNMAREA
jgi:hypothetical protein